MPQQDETAPQQEAPELRAEDCALPPPSNVLDRVFGGLEFDGLAPRGPQGA